MRPFAGPAAEPPRFSATLCVAQPRAIRPHAAQRKNVGRTMRECTRAQSRIAPQRLDCRITSSSPGEAAFTSASSFSTLGTASPRSYRAYALREVVPRRDAISASELPLACRSLRKTSAVIAAASLPETSNSFPRRG